MSLMEGYRHLLIAVLALSLAAHSVQAKNVYNGDRWASLAADNKAAAIGDVLTVVVYQSTEASNSARQNSRKSSAIGGGLAVGSVNEQADLDFGGSYNGGGEIVRSEKFISQLSVTVSKIFPNGDLEIEGQQQMLVNEETTLIKIRGRIRSVDISADNRILSSRVADAQIDYDGRGFVSRSAKPGLVSRIFRFLGLS